MHPLSYQMVKNSCWVTSMINGIFLLTGENMYNITAFTYHLLNCLLKDDGVSFYRPVDFQKYETITKAVERETGLNITNIKGKDVEDAFENKNWSFGLEEEKRVAICTIDNGEHVILINGEGEGEENKRWLHCFDPLWERVRTKKGAPIRNHNSDKYQHVDEGIVNVKIAQHHLLSEKKQKFAMGANYRIMTVIKTG